jgi:hypothetical protein
MVEPKPGEPWPSLLKYGNASILPTKPPGPSKSTKRVPNTYQCFCMLNFVLRDGKKKKTIIVAKCLV